MFPNICRKFAERQSALRRYVFDQNIVSPFRNNEFKYCRCISTTCKVTKTENYPLNSFSKNNKRFCTNIATAVEKKFTDIESSISHNTEITDEDIEKLLQLDWSKITTEEFISNFEKLTLYIKQIQETPNINFDSLLQGISVLSSKFSTKEIIFIFKYTNSWKSERTDNMHIMKRKILKSFNAELKSRLKELQFDEITFFCACYRHVELAKKCFFVIKAIFRLDGKVRKLSSTQISKFMHILGYCSNLPLNFFNIEYAIENKWDTFDQEEIYQVLCAFFKNSYVIKNKDTRVHIYELILNSIEKIKPAHTSGVFKYLSLIYKPADNVDDIIIKILKSIEPRMDELSLKNLISVLNLASSAAIHEKTLVTRILERFNEEIHNLTLVDIERISDSMSVFNYDGSHPFYKNLLNELNNPNREEEISNHSRAFIHTLQSLAYVNIYPENLISKMMDPEYINKHYKNPHAMKSCHYFIDQCMNVEFPNYAGHILSEKLRTFFSKKFSSHELKKNNANKIRQNVLETCQRIFGNLIYSTKILSHFFNEDIVICFDENDNQISPEPFLSPIKEDLVKRIPEEAKNYKWLILIITNRRMILKNSDDYSGVLAMKCRQLKVLGYTPVVVSHYEWYSKKDDEQCEKYREDYLKNLLSIK